MELALAETGLLGHVGYARRFAILSQSLCGGQDAVIGEEDGVEAGRTSCSPVKR